MLAGRWSLHCTVGRKHRTSDSSPEQQWVGCCVWIRNLTRECCSWDSKPDRGAAIIRTSVSARRLHNRFRRDCYWKMTLRNEMNNPRWEVLTAALLKTQILAEVTPCLSANTVVSDIPKDQIAFIVGVNSSVWSKQISVYSAWQKIGKFDTRHYVYWLLYVPLD